MIKKLSNIEKFITAHYLFTPKGNILERVGKTNQKPSIYTVYTIF